MATTEQKDKDKAEDSSTATDKDNTQTNTAQQNKQPTPSKDNPDREQRTSSEPEKDADAGNNNPPLLDEKDASTAVVGQFHCTQNNTSEEKAAHPADAKIVADAKDAKDAHSPRPSASQELLETCSSLSERMQHALLIELMQSFWERLREQSMEC